ncbi:hypothetical protein VNI00_011307 [Paramarasmius palmivorus]|uniref:Smr domain-containing protein n=1 Tax=Paramarasmius palmivorus TaxID=297713 RepID=A0AAW0CGL8_9AGAR
MFCYRDLVRDKNWSADMRRKNNAAVIWMNFSCNICVLLPQHSHIHPCVLESSKCESGGRTAFEDRVSSLSFFLMDAIVKVARFFLNIFCGEDKKSDSPPTQQQPWQQQQSHGQHQQAWQQGHQQYQQQPWHQQPHHQQQQGSQYTHQQQGYPSYGYPPQSPPHSPPHKPSSPPHSPPHKPSSPPHKPSHGQPDQNQVNQSNAHYLDLRKRANEEGDSMAKCFRESQEAYKGGNGARAKELSNEGKEHQKKMEKLNREASEWIYIDEVDLHGLYVKEAIEYTDRALEEAKMNGQREVRLIVGKGLHSSGGVAKIKPAIEELMIKHQLIAELDPDNAGVLIVQMNTSRDRGVGPDEIARRLERKDDGCIVM